jgi:hypothetical protein
LRVFETTFRNNDLLEGIIGLKKDVIGSSIVVNVYNPSYAGGGDGRIMVQGQLRQKLVGPISK